MSRRTLALACAILTAALLAGFAAGTGSAHRLHHHAFPAGKTVAHYRAELAWLKKDMHHVDGIRWREHRILRRDLSAAASRWHASIYRRHLRWFHRDRKAIKWVQRKIAHLQEANAWNSSDLGLIPGVPYSFAACVALRESTNGTASHDVYGILPVSTWANVSLAAQKHQFAHLYALYGTSPWRPYDGC